LVELVCSNGIRATPEAWENPTRGWIVATRGYNLKRGIGFPDATSAVKSFGFPVPRLRVGLSNEITVRPGTLLPRAKTFVLVTDAGDDLVGKLCVVSVSMPSTAEKLR
jgi:hypothetical protein